MLPVEITLGILLMIGIVGFAVTRANAARLDRRIREVKDEMARNPRDPYQALAELMAQRNPTPHSGRRRAANKKSGG